MSIASPAPVAQSSETLAGAALPEDLPGYRLERVIGAGGMGVVYEATQLTLNRRVAVKLIAPQLAGDSTLRARFRREALLQATLEHPHVLQVYEAGICSTGLFIVMRLVRGETLRALLGRGTLAPREALELLGPVADALDAAHARGIVHRDVKPANILIADGRHAYLADFGLVRAAGHDALTRPGALLGTLGYAAPEQLHGGEPSPASDVYAFAVVLRESVGAGAFDDALARGLAFEPEARPRSAGELVRLCRDALGAARRPRRRRVRARAAASCALALGALAWSQLHHGRSLLGAWIGAPTATEMTASDWRRDAPSRGAPAPPRAEGVAVQANILIRGPVSPLRVVCELRDLDTGRVSGVTKVIGMDAATIAPTCWIRGAPVAGHRYQVTMSLWRVGASEPLAAGSRTFVGGNGR